jgi:hypothetical protein
MPTIYDIEQLRALANIADSLSVRFKLHGGVAFRFALEQVRAGQGELSSKADLFDLAPFTADVDLLHSGPNLKTDQVRNAILLHVPHADCFRWEVRSELTQSDFTVASAHEAQIPARSLSLTAFGFEDPLNGMDDINSRRFRFIRKPFYRELSPLYKKGRSLELFPALIYLQTLFEAHLSYAEWTDQPDIESASTVFEEAIANETRESLITSPYLRTRFAYLLVNCILSASPALFWERAAEVHLSDFVDSINDTPILPRELRE